MAILAAVGEQEESKDLVETAYSLARDLDESLVVLHVTPREGFIEHKQEVESLPDIQNYSASQTEESASIFARKVVQRSLGDHDHDDVLTKGRMGDPTGEILKEANELEPRFVVVGGRRRSPVGKAIFGSVTQEVLLESEYPVLTVMFG